MNTDIHQIRTGPLPTGFGLKCSQNAVVTQTWSDMVHLYWCIAYLLQSMTDYYSVQVVFLINYRLKNNKTDETLEYKLIFQIF